MTEYEEKLLEGLKYLKAMVTNATLPRATVTLEIRDNEDDTLTTIKVEHVIRI
jgi:hypothetical protein